MVQIKKISCVIGAIFFIALSAFLPVSAEELTQNFQVYAYSSRWKNTSGVWTDWSYPSGSPKSDFSAMGDLSVSAATTLNCTGIEVGFSAALVDENSIATTLKPGWSYTIGYTIVAKLPNNMTVSSPENYDYSLVACPNFYIAPNTFPYPIDDTNFPSFQSSFTYDQANVSSSYVTWYLYYAYVFNVPSDLSIPQNLTYLMHIISYDDFTTNTQVTPTSWKFTWNEINATYDPTGEIAEETEVDQIIAGQKEAAEYALEQERASVQADLDSAMDQDTSDIDISTVFGSSLVSLYNSITYSGTSFDFKLPSSGTVPILNTVLWEEQTIPIKEYIDKVPSAVWVVINFLLWFLVVRSIIKLVHKLLDLINGDSGGDS